MVLKHATKATAISPSSSCLVPSRNISERRSSTTDYPFSKLILPPRGLRDMLIAMLESGGDATGS